MSGLAGAALRRASLTVSAANLKVERLPATAVDGAFEKVYFGVRRIGRVRVGRACVCVGVGVHTRWLNVRRGATLSKTARPSALFARVLATVVLRSILLIFCS